MRQPMRLCLDDVALARWGLSNRTPSITLAVTFRDVRDVHRQDERFGDDIYATAAKFRNRVLHVVVSYAEMMVAAVFQLSPRSV